MTNDLFATARSDVRSGVTADTFRAARTPLRSGLASLTDMGLVARHDDIAREVRPVHSGRPAAVRPRSTIRTRCAVATIVLTMVVLAGACGGSDDGPDEPEPRGTTTTESPADTATSESTGTTGGTAATTGSPETVGTEPAGSVEDAIVEAYVGFWDARLDANSPPASDASGLDAYATGQVLEDAQAEVASNREQGVEFREADDPADFRRVTVVEVSGDSASVQECVVDDVLVVRSSDGSVVNDAVATQSLRGDLRLVDGRWLLAESTLVQRWDGVAGCALADE